MEYALNSIITSGSTQLAADFRRLAPYGLALGCFIDNSYEFTVYADHDGYWYVNFSAGNIQQALSGTTPRSPIKGAWRIIEGASEHNASFKVVRAPHITLNKKKPIKEFHVKHS